ncbi:MAG: 3',5'-cyclic-nucleotide phosphodiesterase [Burkholderiales bacterium]|nr:3',5'-cyclic-nucleotide phosphodiesterase [Burkholderiales bacterium]
MRLRILGCSGGIGGSRRTTCLLLNHDTLIDCGTGAGDLDLDEMIAIDRIFLTHSHLDHVALLPMLADSAGNFRNRPLLVHALPETIEILKSDIFNSRIWPDYSKQPTPENPYIRFVEIEVGQSVDLGYGKITALPVKHSVPGVGYLLDSGKSCFAFSGDTTDCDEFWDALKASPCLKYLLVEATFLDRAAEQAEKSGHMTPTLLAKGFEKIGGEVNFLITHMEAGREEESMQEIHSGPFFPIRVENGQTFEF